MRKPIARAPVPRKARHARDPAGAARDGPRLSAGPGLGLADADPVERAHGAPAPAREAGPWPRRAGGSSTDHPGGEARGDQFRLVHQEEPVQGGQGRAVAELLRVGGGASVREAGPQGAEARGGCAGTAFAGPPRCRQGSPDRMAARITELSPRPRVKNSFDGYAPGRYDSPPDRRSHKARSQALPASTRLAQRGAWAYCVHSP